MEFEQAEGSAPRKSVEVVGAFYEHFNRWDIDAAVELLAEDFDWRPAFGRSLMGGNSYAGREGFRHYCSDIEDSFSAYQSHLQGLEAVGRDNVVAEVRASGFGRTSGIEVERLFWIVYLVRDGQIAKGETFDDRLDALRSAAGVT